MRGIKFYIVSFVMLCLVLQAQNRFEFDYARFYNPADSSGYLELYYSFYHPQLKTVNDGSGLIKQGELAVKIIDIINNETIVDNNWQLDIPVSASEESQSNLLVGQLDFPLEYSNYQIDISARDLNNNAFNETSSFELIFSPFSEAELVVSDIQLAAGIVTQSTNEESIFYKNSLEVTPNPSLVYGDLHPVLFFYSEIYGLQSENFENCLIEQKLIDPNNAVAFNKSRIVIGKNPAVVEAGAIRVNELNSGVYTLIVSVKDNENRISANSAKRVYIYNRDLVDTSTDFLAATLTPLESELMMMSEDEIDFMFETAQYIATETEKTQWKKLTEIDSKRQFLGAFWQKRDTDTKTPINEYKRDYYERVNYANKNYGNLSRPEGWKTDRGRVYIMYGAPGEIERFQNEYYSKPYEIWQYYDLEGGVIFLFADEQGLNIYRLVHSTKRGEINNYREYLKYVQ